MNQFQNIHFSNVEEFLEHLPSDQRDIVDILRFTIQNSLINYTEKLAYNVPFYYGNRRICYIWPSSVPWGKLKFRGVQLGFCYGNLLSDELNYLEKGGRKQVLLKTFASIDQINTDLIKTFLFEAVEIDRKW